MMALILGIVWGGFAALLAYSMKAEARSADEAAANGALEFLDSTSDATGTTDDATGPGDDDV